MRFVSNKPLAALAAVALAASALGSAGCEEYASRAGDASAGGRRGAELRLRTMPADPELAATPMYRVRVVRMLHRLRPDAEEDDLWSVLNAAAVPHEKQAMWRANDLRLAKGESPAAEVMQNLLAASPDREVKVHTIYVRENHDFRVSFGPQREAVDILWADETGRLRGRHFEEARLEFRVVCRRLPEAPETVAVGIVPEVPYGKQRLRWVRTENGYTQQAGQARFTLSELAVEVPLETGRLLVLGGERSSEISLGGAYFYERRGPDLWVQTAVFTAVPIPAAEVPGAEADTPPTEGETEADDGREPPPPPGSPATR